MAGQKTLVVLERRGNEGISKKSKKRLISLEACFHEINVSSTAVDNEN